MLCLSGKSLRITEIPGVPKLYFCTDTAEQFRVRKYNFCFLPENFRSADDSSASLFISFISVFISAVQRLPGKCFSGFIQQKMPHQHAQQIRKYFSLFCMGK